MTGALLRKLEADDLSLRASWLRHEQPLGTMPLVGRYDDRETTEWFARTQSDKSRVDTVLQAGRDLVATGGLTAIDSVVGKAELYAVVSPSHRGRGHGVRLVLGLCELAFDELGLNRVFLWTYSTNNAALRLYERCGFRKEGTLRQHAVSRNIRVDRVAMGLLAHEWVSDNKNDIPTLAANLRGRKQQ